MCDLRSRSTSAVKTKTAGLVVFVGLPRDAQRPIDGGCGCRYCTPIAGIPGDAWWDTLVVPTDGRATYLCHAPEYQGALPLRAEV